jgi:glycosyltransferase involved in cell wall biosynthesis
MENNKLIYILPEASTTTHMKYNVEFLESLSKDVDIFLIIERGSLPENFQQKIGVKYLRYTGNKSTLLRVLRLIFFMYEALFRGYRKTYVHYSFLAAFVFSLHPFFRVFYWNCGIPMSYKRPFFQELYESTTYKLIDHFVTGAKVLATQYSKFYKFDNRKSIIIPNWIDIAKTRMILENINKKELKEELNILPTDKILFFNQRLAERKGAHYIPQILSSLTPGGQGGEVVMIITNDGPYKSKLIETLKDKNLIDRVRMLGRVPNDKVIQLMSISDIYILPSEEEGMSHSLMEAQCASVAAVAFDVGGTIDMFPTNFSQFVVPREDISTFIQRVQELLRNADLRQSLGQALLDQVRTFDKPLILTQFKSKILW